MVLSELGPHATATELVVGHAIASAPDRRLVTCRRASLYLSRRIGQQKEE